MSTVAIVAIGDELLDGRVHESNAYWLGAELLKEGFSLTRTVSCRDQLTEILSTLKFAAEVAEVVIVSGGMGPTSDDLTREAVAKMLQTELVFDQASVNAIEGQLAKRGLTLNETNRRQAFHPRGSVVIPNPGGTAPGFYANTASGKIVCALPGVPSELKALFAASVLPVLQAQFPDRKRLREQGVRLFGIPEAEVGLRIEQLKLPATITVCYRTVFPEIEVLLRIEDRSDADTALDAAIQRVLQAVPEKTIVSRNPKRSLPHVVAEELLRLGKGVSVAESCTAGMLGSLLTECAGASGFFKGGVISYANEVKREVLGVPEAFLQKYGAVSEQVACAMAAGVRKLCGSSLGVSITGVAGPDGGSDEKPVGTFWVGIADGDGARAERFFYPGSRERIRRYACYAALGKIRM